MGGCATECAPSVDLPRAPASLTSAAGKHYAVFRDPVAATEDYARKRTTFLPESGSEVALVEVPVPSGEC